MTTATLAAGAPPRRWPVISALGVTQILAWGSSYYLPAVLAGPMAADTGWPLSWVVGGLSAGLVIAATASPYVGRVIARRGGRPVLMTSAVLLAAGLCGLAFAPSLPMFLAAWIVLGLGMAAGLYDPAFATLGRLYGTGGRSAITTLTLFGGFARHGMLAPVGLPRDASRLARGLSDLCGHSARGLAAGLSIGPAT